MTTRTRTKSTVKEEGDLSGQLQEDISALSGVKAEPKLPYISSLQKSSFTLPGVQTRRSAALNMSTPLSKSEDLQAEGVEDSSLSTMNDLLSLTDDDASE